MIPDRATAALSAVALGALAFAAYAPVPSLPFIGYDDGPRLLDNPSVRSGLSWQNVLWAFTSVWDANWSPLTWISHMLDFSLYGDDPAGHHTTSLLLHVANVLLLFGALQAVSQAVLPSACVAALLALHPIHVESVAWLSERKGLLSSTFAFASIWAYAVHARGGGSRARNLALLCLALGSLAKAMLVSLPLLFLLVDLWLGRIGGPGAGPSSFEQRSMRTRLFEKWPYIAVASASVVAALFAQSTGGAVRAVEVLPLGPRLANAVVSYLRYLEMLAWPRDLAVFYPHPYLPGGTPWSAATVGGAAVLLVLLGWIAWRARRTPVGIGLLWYAVALLPVIGLVQVGVQALADRYAYVPAVGIYLACVFGLAGWLRSPVQRVASLVGFAGIVVALGLATRSQLEVWRSSESLFRHATMVTPSNYSMHFNLGNTLKAEGRSEEAIAEFRAAVASFPGMMRAHFNLANTLRAQNDLDGSIHHYREVLRIAPDFGPAREKLGRALISKGDLPGALAHFREETHLRPEDAVAHATLGHLLVMNGELQSALESYQSAMALKPDDAGLRRDIRALRSRLAGETPP